MTLVRNDCFDPSLGFERGRSSSFFAFWQVVKVIFFKSSFPWPSVAKRVLLRLFGASVGAGVVIKPCVNIHFPWKLFIGDHAWIGEDVCVLNFESIRIGRHACVSQRVFLCGGNHDYRDPCMAYRNAPIVLNDGVWVGAQVFVAPGVIVGTDAVITAGSVVLSSVPDGMVCSGNPCIAIKRRWL